MRTKLWIASQMLSSQHLSAPNSTSVMNRSADYEGAAARRGAPAVDQPIAPRPTAKITA